MKPIQHCTYFDACARHAVPPASLAAPASITAAPAAAVAAGGSYRRHQAGCRQAARPALQHPPLLDCQGVPEQQVLSEACQQMVGQAAFTTRQLCIGDLQVCVRGVTMLIHDLGMCVGNQTAGRSVTQLKGRCFSLRPALGSCPIKGGCVIMTR